MVLGAECCAVVRACGVVGSTVARGVQLWAVGVDIGLSESLGSAFARAGLKGDASGVVCCRRGDGDAGDSGLRNGELRGEPNWPNGEGL
jgi:hypothetical protein